MQLEGIDNVSAAEAKIAFMSIDPGINIEIIRKYISVNMLFYYFFVYRSYFQYGLAGEESQNTETFLRNLKNSPVFRVSAAVQF